MLQKLEITGIHLDVKEPLRKYITQKLGNLDRYIPKHSRESAHMEVRLFETKIDGRKQPVCEVTLHVPRESITLKEHGATPYAATDIVETKLKLKIKDYKEKLTSGERSQHVWGRLRRHLVFKLPETL